MRLRGLGGIVSAGVISLAGAGCVSIDEFPEQRMSREPARPDNASKALEGTARNVPIYYGQVAFDHIRMDYRRGLHDCDDMAQEFRDYLRTWGISYERMRLVELESRAFFLRCVFVGRHMWLEVLEEGCWNVYDPAGNVFGKPVHEAIKNYSVVKIYRGDEVYTEPSGEYFMKSYREIGDRFINGMWKRRKAPEDSNK